MKYFCYSKRTQIDKHEAVETLTITPPLLLRLTFHMSHPQIEKDLLRTMPTNACFNNLSSVGVPRLRRVLRGLAWLYPDIGYCQGTGMVRKHILNDIYHHKQTLAATDS